ncbi:MAG TPA: hypothetical protein VM690_07540 [Gaiellaceae bacterium]|nr:hypothetical protein [Gaiellaceae bacterium]
MSTPPGHGPPPEDAAEKRRKRIAELEEKKAARDRKLVEEKEAHDLACLELEERLSNELNGVEKRAFMIVNRDNACGVGPVAVKPAELSRWKGWKAKEGNKPEDAFALVQSCLVFPDLDTFARAYHAHPWILEKAIAGVAILAGVSESELAGKF